MLTISNSRCVLFQAVCVSADPITVLRRRTLLSCQLHAASTGEPASV